MSGGRWYGRGLGGIRNDGQRLYFDFGKPLEQAADFNKGHCRKVLAHQLAVSRADIADTRRILILVGNEDQQAGDVFRGAAGLAHNGQNILESLSELVSEVVADQSAFFVPPDLTCYEKKRAALEQQAVVVADRLTQSIRVDYLHLLSVRCLRSQVSLLHFESAVLFQLPGCSFSGCPLNESDPGSVIIDRAVLSYLANYLDRFEGARRSCYVFGSGYLK